MEVKKPHICDEHKVTSEKIDRLENHFKVYKSDMQDVKNTLIDIKNSMIGSSFNGNKGFIHLLDDVNERLENIESKQPLTDEAIKQAKYGVSVMFTAIVGGVVSFLVWVFSK
jgi:hypothetical protein